jgi:hypothetical protein
MNTCKAVSWLCHFCIVPPQAHMSRQQQQQLAPERRLELLSTR